MNFSKQKKELIHTSKGQALSTFIFALITATVMFLPGILAGNGYFIFYGDFNAQQIPFYQTCHEAVKSGNINWNWNTDLGSEFIGSYSFYLLGSPFFWLTIPFPTEFVPYLMGPLLILKFACAALTAYFYIRRFTFNPSSARAGALLYAFSSFCVYNIFFNHFHESIIVFPLLLLSMELLWTENRRGAFALCVALSAVVNYFFFAGMVVFCVIYWVVRLISGAIKFKFSRFCVLVFEAVLGVAIAAFLLLPSLLMILGNSRVSEFQLGWNGILYGKEQIYFQILQSLFFPPDIPAHPVFVPHLGVKWSSVAAWLPAVGITAVLGFCCSKKGSWLKRMLCVSAFMACVPVLNSAFYAFNSSYYARWYYMPILLMCLASAVTFEDETVDWKKGWKIASVITVAIIATVGLFPQKVNGKIVLGLYTDAGKEDNVYLYRFLLSSAIAVFCIIICRGFIALRKNTKTMLRTVTASICVISVIYGAVFIYCGQTHSADIEETVIDRLIECELELPNSDYQKYRIDVYGGSDNTGMYLGYPTVNAFHSVVSNSIMEFYDYIGIERNVASRPDVNYTSLRSLLSVKYLINPTNSERFVDEDGNTLMDGYNYITTSDGYYIYENQNYIPYGFSYDYYITVSECENLFREKERSDVMLKALVVPDDTDISLLSGMQHFDVQKLRNTGIYDGIAYDESENQIEKEEYEISLNFDNSTLSKDAKHLSKSSAYEFYYDNNGFYATVERQKGNLVFFSVPYDSGWSAFVNGERTEIIKTNVGFMAVWVDEGISNITFEYTATGLYSGIKISIGALVIFVLYIILSAVIKPKKESRYIYPEGEKLLAVWCRKQTEEESMIEINSKAEEPESVDNKLENDTEKYVPRYEKGFHIDLSDFKSDILKNRENDD